LIGYAARFDQLSQELWGFKEKIAKGAFANSIGEGRSIKALWNHNSDFPIGSTDSGTLTLVEDDIGLRFELSPIATSTGNDAIEAVRSGVVKGVSFGFRTIKDEWDFSDDTMAIRTLAEVELIEISPTPFPAYTATSISARSVEEVFKEAKKQQEPLKKDYKTSNLRAKIDFLSKIYDN
jgi:HK97 family phage prohead protease